MSKIIINQIIAFLRHIFSYLKISFKQTHHKKTLKTQIASEYYCGLEKQLTEWDTKEDDEAFKDL